MNITRVDPRYYRGRGPHAHEHDGVGLGRGGPANPGVGANGSANSLAMFSSVAAALRFALRLSAVPPGKPPFIWRTRHLTLDA